MGWLSKQELKEMGFKLLGSNVLISNKASIYNCEQIEIGDNSRIDDFCVISGRVIIGRNVHIAVFCNVAGGEKGIIFEDFSGFAYGVQAFSQSDDYSGRSLTNPTVPDDFKNEKKEPIHVGKHVIVGTSSIIMPGVTLREGSAIGALTLVNSSTQEWSIYIGNPAKRIKERQKDLLGLEKKYLAN